MLEKTFNIKNDIVVRRNAGKDNYSYYIYAKGEELSWRSVTRSYRQSVVRGIYQGAFIASGSMSDPSKSYHFEIVCNDKNQAEHLQEMMNSFDVDAKIVQRKRTYVVYLKEGSQIVDILNVMEAHVALMELENVRIMKEMRNSVNPKSKL